MRLYRAIHSGRTRQSGVINGRRLGQLLDGTQFYNMRVSRHGGGLIGEIGSWLNGATTFGTGSEEILDSLGWMGLTFGRVGGDIIVGPPFNPEPVPFDTSGVLPWLQRGGQIVIGLPDVWAFNIDSLYSVAWLEGISGQITNWLSGLVGQEVPPVLDPHVRPFVPAEYVDLPMGWTVDEQMPGIVQGWMTEPLWPSHITPAHITAEVVRVVHPLQTNILIPHWGACLAISEHYSPLVTYHGSQLAADYQNSSDDDYRDARLIAQWAGAGVIAAEYPIGYGRVYILQRDFGPFRSTDGSLTLETDRSLCWLIDWRDKGYSALIGPDADDDSGWSEIL